MGKRSSLTVALLAVCGVVLAGGAGGLAASALADDTTTTATTTTEASTTSATTTVETPTTVPAVSTTVTTAPTTTAATTTAPPTTTAPKPGAAPVPSATLVDRGLTSGCPVSAVAVVRPGRIPGLLGPVAAGPADGAVLSRLRYAAGGPVFSGADVHVSGGGCGSRPARVSIASVSLFGGALSADSISLTVGRREARTIDGLRVGDARVSASSRGWLPLRRWGEWRIGSSAGAGVAALTIRLLQTHAGLPAGTMVLVAVAGSHARTSVATPPLRQHRRHRRRLAGRPLRVTPPLGVAHEIFPVVGADASFVDTYGGFRSDVAGNWHHGDDIFAPLGTPVVAVAAGTINRVGWNQVGGWRLWVRDDAGDQFYYAHLSGYTSDDLHSRRVRAGEVIGFVGNTGDAFTTAPHLHFEIHPRSLLHLQYNGAVDPTGYLQSWTHLSHVDAPRPAHPPLPAQPVLRAEARHVWRELLSARHFERHAPDVDAASPPPGDFPLQFQTLAAPLGIDAAPAAQQPHSTSWLVIVVLPLALVLGLGAFSPYTPVNEILKRRKHDANHT